MEKRKLNFGRLLPDQGFGFGSFNLEGGGFGHYVFTGTANAFLIVRSYDEEGKSIGTYVATRDETKHMDEKKVTPESGNFTKYCGTLEDRGEKFGRDEMRSFLEGIAPSARGKGENDVQTEEEARIANDTNLIKQIQTIYEKGGKCMELAMQKELSILHTIPVVEGGVVTKKPVVHTAFTCVAGEDLLPDRVIWKDPNVLVCGKETIKIDEYRNFMYENVQKSSKTSYGLGLSLGSPTGIGSAGPELGKSVYSNGKPMTGAGGPSISFNYESCKTWAKLKIEAEFRLNREVTGLICLKY